MIHYQLRCSGDHSFDGWFKDSAAFDRQAAAGLVECPECGATSVHRALMAPSIRKKRGAAAVPATVDAAGTPDAAPVPTPQKAASTIPDQVRGMLQKLRAEVERNCEHVGERFADEALAIHRGESEARGIYGETTPEQAAALADEGVPVSRIPWVPRADG